METDHSSEDYEEKALEALAANKLDRAAIFSQLALVAVVREAAIVLLTIEDDDEDDDDEDIEGDDDE